MKDFETHPAIPESQQDIILSGTAEALEQAIDNDDYMSPRIYDPAPAIQDGLEGVNRDLPGSPSPRRQGRNRETSINTPSPSSSGGVRHGRSIEVWPTPRYRNSGVIQEEEAASERFPDLDLDSTVNIREEIVPSSGAQHSLESSSTQRAAPTSNSTHTLISAPDIRVLQTQRRARAVAQSSTSFGGPEGTAMATILPSAPQIPNPPQNGPATTSRVSSLELSDPPARSGYPPPPPPGRTPPPVPITGVTDSSGQYANRAPMLATPRHPPVESTQSLDRPSMAFGGISERGTDSLPSRSSGNIHSMRVVSGTDSNSRSFSSGRYPPGGLSSNGSASYPGLEARHANGISTGSPLHANVDRDYTGAISISHSEFSEGEDVKGPQSRSSSGQNHSTLRQTLRNSVSQWSLRRSSRETGEVQNDRQLKKSGSLASFATFFNRGQNVSENEDAENVAQKPRNSFFGGLSRKHREKSRGSSHKARLSIVNEASTQPGPAPNPRPHISSPRLLITGQCRIPIPTQTVGNARSLQALSPPRQVLIGHAQSPSSSRRSEAQTQGQILPTGRTQPRFSHPALNSTANTRADQIERPSGLQGVSAGHQELMQAQLQPMPSGRTEHQAPAPVFNSGVNVREPRMESSSHQQRHSSDPFSDDQSALPMEPRIGSRPSRHRRTHAVTSLPIGGRAVNSPHVYSSGSPRPRHHAAH